MSTELAPPPERKKILRADTRVLIAIAVIAVLFDWAARANLNGLAAVLLFGGSVAAFVMTRRFRNRESLVALGLAVVFALWLGIRSSAWLVVPDFLAALFLVAVAASFGSGGSVFNLSVPATFDRGFRLAIHGLAAPAFVLRPLKGHTPQRMQKVAPVLTGLIVVAPIVLILCALLASADAVFASLFDFELNIDTAISHVILLVIGGWAAGGALRAVSSDQPKALGTPSWQLGVVEAIVALSAVVLLYAVFVMTQIVVWLGGADHVLSEHGMTYAQHAREGFFQLLAVAAITLGLLMTLKGTMKRGTESQHRWWLICSGAAIVLTLVIVGVALQRLALYEDVYGLTMLRLYSTIFAVWIGIVFLIFGYALLSGNNKWFLAAATSTGLLILLGLNFLNPEAFVINRNVDRPSTSVPFDTGYSEFLSDDALPALSDALPKLDANQQADVLSTICHQGLSNTEWTQANWSKSQADDVRKQVCPAYWSPPQS